MDKKTLIARLRQLQAADRNALAIYTDLTELVQDADQHRIFSGIAEDEKLHVALGKEILSLLES
ncbi:MAG: hypothetical protein PHY35_03535 [Candidatus Omnitrophica bacterium]|nr:hypothetical protein [Candidatus Omnitrophota bacterium]